MVMNILLITAVTVLLFVPAAEAQEMTNMHARPGYATKTIYVWGSVSSPGIWRVEQDVDLIELLTVVKIGSIRTSERRILRIYRGTADNRNEIYNEDLEHVLDGDQTYPMLQDGDVVVVDTKAKFTPGSIIAAIGAVAAFALLLIRLEERL